MSKSSWAYSVNNPFLLTGILRKNNRKCNLIKIRCLCIFFHLFIFGDTLTSNNIPFAVMSRFIFSTDKSAMSLL